MYRHVILFPAHELRDLAHELCEFIALAILESHIRCEQPSRAHSLLPEIRMNSRFSLRTFGAPALLDGRGRPLPLRKKDLALLIYLRIENKPCSRSALAGLLWGEATEAKARHSLTQTIGRLREQLGSDSIVPSNGDVALQSELECDAARLLAGAEFHPDGYHGDFLAAFAPGTGSESFMEWADGKRTVCRLRLTKLLDSLGAAAEADEHYGEALQLGLQLT